MGPQNQLFTLDKRNSEKVNFILCMHIIIGMLEVTKKKAAVRVNLCKIYG